MLSIIIINRKGKPFMTLRTIKYPFDPTATSRDNLVTEERQVEREYNRALAPYGGDFYADTMKVYDVATNKELTRLIDFRTLYINDEAERRTGMPVHAIVHIINKDYTKVRLEYQVPGGLFSSNYDALVQIMNELSQDDRKVEWDNIFGKPTEFNPAPHLHHASDIYGMEFVVLALEELQRAIIEGDNASHDILYDYINRVKDDLNDFKKEQDGINKDIYKQIDRLDERCDNLQQQITKLGNDLSTHVSDYNNPHRVTKAQVGLGNVENYALATQQQAEAGTVNDCYMTPLRSRQGVIYYWTNTMKPYVDNKINAHLNDKNNPHGVTKVQVGLGNVDNYPTANQDEAIAGTRNDRFMTPLRTMDSIKTNAIGPLNAHINNKNNPHNVTKEQVGLGNVNNWGRATDQDAIYATDKTGYLTPNHLKLYHDAMMTISTVEPILTSMFSNGHVWYVIE